jgi:hypothetical protein
MLIRSALLASFASGLLLVGGCSADADSEAAGAELGADEATESAELQRARNDLSAAQQKSVLAELNLRCGDIWCNGGDFRFDFQRVRCGFAATSCTLTIRIVDIYGAAPGTIYWRSCKMTNTPSYKALVSTDAGGRKSVAEVLETNVDACVARAETELMH